MQEKRYRIWMQHVANPLHVYCRLVDLGLGVHVSKRLSMFYERHFYSTFVRGFRPCNSLERRSLS